MKPFYAEAIDLSEVQNRTGSIDRSPPNREVTVLLGQHYGDGSVYLHDASDRVLLKRAIEGGYVSPEGYLTPAGHQLWLRMQLCSAA